MQILRVLYAGFIHNCKDIFFTDILNLCECGKMLAMKRTIRKIVDGKGVILLRVAFIDALGDLNAALILSEIFYWCTPGRNGDDKLTLEIDGRLWIAASRKYWQKKIRMTPDQADRAIKILCDAGLIEKQLFPVRGRETTHVRLSDKFDEIICEKLNGNVKKLEPAKTPNVKEFNVKGIVKENTPRPSPPRDSPNPIFRSDPRVQTTVLSRADDGRKRKSHSIPLKLRLYIRLYYARRKILKKKNQNQSDSIQMDNQKDLGLGGRKMNYRWELANGQDQEEIKSLMRAGMARYNVSGEIEIRVEVEDVPPPENETPEEYFARLTRERNANVANAFGISSDDYKARISAAIATGVEQKRSSGLPAPVLEYVYGLPEQMTGLAYEFCSGFGRAPLKTEIGRWRNDFQSMLDMGLEPRDVKQAIKRMKNDGLTIKAPGSVTTIAWNIHSDRKERK